MHAHLVDAGAVNGEEAKEPTCVPIGVVEADQGQVLILVILVPRTFLCRVREIRARRPIPVSVHDRGVPQTELAHCQARMGSLYRHDGPSDYSLG